MQTAIVATAVAIPLAIFGGAAVIEAILPEIPAAGTAGEAAEAAEAETVRIRVADVATRIATSEARIRVATFAEEAAEEELETERLIEPLKQMRVR